MKNLTLLFIFMLTILIACGDDTTSPPVDDSTGLADNDSTGCSDDNLTEPSKDGAVLISGCGSNAEFDSFEFGVTPDLGWLIIFAYESTDTLTFILVDYSSIEVNSAISLTDSNLLISGTFGSGEYLASNIFNFSDEVTGSFTFTSLDTSGSIAASFSSGATLGSINLATGEVYTATIAGDFVATKAAGSAVAANIVRRYGISRLLKRF